jgi:hypothetical protein
VREPEGGSGERDDHTTWMHDPGGSRRVSHQNPHRTRRKRAVLFTVADLPLGAHLALGSLALLVIVTTFSDFGTREMLATAYFAAILYGAVNVCHGFLREHTPAGPQRLRLVPFLTYAAWAVLLTAYFRVVTGANPMELTPTTATVASGLLLLFVAAFVDTITNRTHLGRSRDPKRPYAGLPRWIPTWRAAALPLAALLAFAHAGSLGYVQPVTLSTGMVMLALVHVGSLVVASLRGAR